MSHDACNLVRRHKFGSAARKAVVYVLADYADANLSCFVGQERLASEAEVGERSVRRILAMLQKEGLVRREARFKSGHRRTSDRIYLVRAAIEKLPATLAGSAPELPATDDIPPANRAELPATDDTATGQSLAGYPLGEPPGEPSDRPASRARSRARPSQQANNDKANGSVEPEAYALYDQLLAAKQLRDRTDINPGLRERGAREFEKAKRGLAELGIKVA